MRLMMSGRVGPVAKRPPRTAGNQSAAAAAHTKEKDDVAHAIEQVKAQRATSSKRKRWTADEEEALRNGIKRCVSLLHPLCSVRL
jgi:hypothetical protein